MTAMVLGGQMVWVKVHLLVSQLERRMEPLMAEQSVTSKADLKAVTTATWSVEHLVCSMVDWLVA